MAQRATVLVEKETPVPKRAGRGSRGSAPPPPRAVPVDLRKLVAPYRGKGRLTIRAERMPTLARFSAGRNNGDNSWSFALDELEDLLYLPGAAFDAPQTLDIRIIAGDTTIAVLDYEITAEVSISVVEPAAPDAAALEQLRHLRDELSQMALRLAARDADLDAARAETKNAQNEFARARDAWQQETDARVAATETSASGRVAETRTRAARETDEARAKARKLGEDFLTLQKALAERDVELAQLRTTASEAPAKTERAIREALSKAEKIWKASEAGLLAAAEAQWREQSEHALTQAQASAKKTESEKQKELVRVSGELLTLRKQLAERDGEVSQLRANLSKAPAEIDRAIRDAVSKAEDVWKARESQRLASAEAQWREQSERTLADAHAAAGQSVSEKQSELGRLTGELATLRTQLSERDLELAQLRASLAIAPGEAERVTRDTLSKAEENWKAGEALRLAAAEARLREQSDHALADARAAAQKSLDEEKSERERAINELAALRAQLAERETDVAKLQSAMLQAGARQERNLQDALETWKAGETVRLEAAHAHWKTQAAELRAEFETSRMRAEAEASAHATAQTAQHEAELRRLNNDLASSRQLLAARDAELALSRAGLAQTQARAEKDIDMARATAERDARERFAAKFAEAVARYEAAEAALGEMRRRAGTHGADETAVLRDEINTLRMVLANRESELAQARLANVKASGRDDGEASDNRGFIFSALALACAVMAAILFYPQIVSSLPYDWQVELANLTGGIQYNTGDTAAANAQAAAPAAPAQAKAIVVRGVNLRADASAKSDVLATLEPGTEVAEIGKRGNWTRIEARAGQKAQQGWVYNSFLQPKDASPKAGGR